MDPVHFEIFADIAGWVSRDNAPWNDRVTCAAVAVDSDSAQKLRNHVRKRFSKWGCSDIASASDMIDLLCASASGIAICSWTKADPAWTDFWADAKPLQDAIVKQENAVAGFVKPANVARYLMFTTAFARALGCAVLAAKSQTARDQSGMPIYECSLTCDSDVQGERNIEVFKHLFFTSFSNESQTRQRGTRLITKEARISTEDAEPLLLLADFAAGIGHSAHIPNPGRISMPVSYSDCRQLLTKLDSTGRTAISDQPFSLQYPEIFGGIYPEVTAQKK